MLAQYDRFCAVLEKSTIVLLTLLLTEMLVVAWAHVFYRYVLDDALFWSEELLRFSLVWFALLSASLIFKRKGHLGIVLIVQKLPEALQNGIAVALVYVFLALNLVVAYQGFYLLGSVHAQLTPALRIPVSLPYASVPISFALMALYGISDVLHQFLGTE